MNKTVTQTEALKVLGDYSGRLGTKMTSAGLVGKIDKSNWKNGEAVLYSRLNVFYGLISRQLIDAGLPWISAKEAIAYISGISANYDNPEQLFSQSLKVNRELTPTGYQDYFSFYDGEAPEPEKGITVKFSEHWKKAGDFIKKNGKIRDRQKNETKERKISTTANIIVADERGMIELPSNF